MGLDCDEHESNYHPTLQFPSGLESMIPFFSCYYLFLHLPLMLWFTVTYRTTEMKAQAETCWYSQNVVDISKYHMRC